MYTVRFKLLRCIAELKCIVRKAQYQTKLISLQNITTLQQLRPTLTPDASNHTITTEHLGLNSNIQIHKNI